MIIQEPILCITMRELNNIYDDFKGRNGDHGVDGTKGEKGDIGLEGQKGNQVQWEAKYNMIICSFNIILLSFVFVCTG